MYDVYDVLFSSLPIFFIGIIVGAVQQLHNDEAEKLSRYQKIMHFFKSSTSAGILALATFLISDNFDMSYSTRIGISVFVSFAGYDKLQSLFEKILDSINKKI